MRESLFFARAAACARAARRGGLPGLVIVLLAACDLSVTNPSKIPGTALEDPQFVHSVVTGAASDVGYAATVPSYGGVFVIGSLLSDELVATDTRVGPRLMSDGVVRDDIAEAQSWWGYFARAHWTSENAVERAKRLLTDPGSQPDVAVADVWAGFANRIGGDNFCNAVVNGGPLEPTSVYFERALDYFTDAIAVGEAAGIDSLVTAAYAGRAQANMMLGRWTDAVADARHVPTDFTFWIDNSTAGRNLNRWWTYGRSTDGRYTVWGTPFLAMGVDYNGDRNVGDPRVIWEYKTESGDTLVGVDGRRPWVALRKYLSTSADVPLAKGSEMRLIAAEAELVAGNWSAAVDSINALRVYLNANHPSAWGTNRLAEVTAADANEAWVALMEERGAELWLEGRRLPDLRRWAVTPGKANVPFTKVRKATNSPNASDDPWVSVYDASTDLCFAVSLNEKLSNPNIPDDIPPGGLPPDDGTDPDELPRTPIFGTRQP
jgi:hypothetical protein